MGMSPKEPSGASKNQKPSFPKTLKTHMFFIGFWLQRHLKKASRGPRWLPKDTRKIQDPKNRNPKLRPKFYPILGTPFPLISGIQIMPRQKVNESGEKTV